jgi:hypothetical protein
VSVSLPIDPDTFVSPRPSVFEETT